jgi:hypothetical protein
MDRVNNLVAVDFQVHHGVSQEISSGSLYSGLEETTTNQLIPTPLSSERILTMYSDAQFLLAPWCGEQLELWPLPTDQSA